MALNIDIPSIVPTVEDATKPKKKATGIDISSAPVLDLDALLQKIQSVKPDSGSTKGRAPSAIASKIAECLVGLCEKARDAGIARLPFGSTVKTIAVALGVEADKKSQYFYTLGQSVFKVLGDKVPTEKDGRNVFLICIPGTDAASEVAPSTE